MPHILLEDCFLASPCESEGYNFKTIFKYKNEHRTEYKILVEKEKSEFLLSLKQKDNTWLLKSDKTTRISPIEIVKNSINAYAKLTNSKILFSNTQNLGKAKASDAYHKDISFFLNDFNNLRKNKKTFLEIGFGSGRHLLYLAKKNPEDVFIGLEIHKPSLEQVLRQIHLQGLKNIYLLDYDARIFLEFLSSNSLEKIFVHFPVPWDKKPHRRVFSKDFINQSLRVLSPNSSLELRTDSRKYFDFCLGLTTNLNRAKIQIDINKELEISSKYEDRWKKQEKNIYDIKLYSQNISKELELFDDFSFECEFDFDKIIQKEYKNPFVFSKYFVHFEKIYILSKTSGLILLSFGDFSRPLSKYLIFENNKCRYFQGKPLASFANIEAHKKIKELLSQ